MNTKTIVFLIIAVLLFGGLFVLLKPKEKLQENSNQAVVANQKIQEKTFEIVVKNRKIVSGMETLQVNEGDNVIIKITVDEVGEIHLHGYDKMVELEKNIQGELSFTANLTGRFPFELESSKTDLGVLEVMPKS